jgi:probable HAF family extracellular repeat protein
MLAEGGTRVRVIDLGTLEGGWPSFAYDINSACTIVGYNLLGPNYGGPRHAARWNPANGQWSVEDLTPLRAGSTSSAAAEINDDGDIVGGMTLANAETHAFVLNATGQLIDLHGALRCNDPDNTAASIDAVDVNDVGEVVGRWRGGCR